MVQEEACSRIDHTEGYTELVLHTATQRATERLFEHVSDLYPIHSAVDSPPMRLLIVFSLFDFPPLKPLATQVNLFRQVYPVSLHPRTAVLYGSILTGMVDSILHTFTFSSETQVRIFLPAQRDEAIEWLLKD